MKRLLLVCVLLGLLLWGGGCVYRSARNAAPERTVTRMMNALRNGKLEKAERYTVNGLGFSPRNRREKQLYKAMHQTLDFVVAETQVQEDQAQVTLMVTMVDMEQLLTATAYSNLTRSLEGKTYNHYQALRKQIQREDAPMQSATLSLPLFRTEAGWQVDLENCAGFLAAVTGGIGPL